MNQSYLWIVSPSQFKSYTLPKRADIEQAVAPFLSAISTEGSSPSDAKRIGDETAAADPARTPRLDSPKTPAHRR